MERPELDPYEVDDVEIPLPWGDEPVCWAICSDVDETDELSEHGTDAAELGTDATETSRS